MLVFHPHLCSVFYVIILLNIESCISLSAFYLYLCSVLLLKVSSCVVVSVLPKSMVGIIIYD